MRDTSQGGFIVETRCYSKSIAGYMTGFILKIATVTRATLLEPQRKVGWDST